MKIEHINLVITDLEQSLRFYRAAFPHWKIRAKGGGEWYGKPRTWVHFGDDNHYLALNEFGEGNNRDLKGHTVGLAHFAIETQNLDAVIARLELAGFHVAHPGADEPYRRNVYFIDPDGFEVEFIQYFSDLPYERNAQPIEVTEEANALQQQLEGAAQ